MTKKVITIKIKRDDLQLFYDMPFADLVGFLQELDAQDVMYLFDEYLAHTWQDSQHAFAEFAKRHESIQAES